MTQKDFDQAVARTRLQDRTKVAAHMVLVDGLSKAEAGRRVGLSREAVRRAVARIERAWRDIQGCPRGWELVTVCLPPKKAQEVRAIEERYKAKFAKTGNPP